MNAVAFGKPMPLGARINALFSSDIGHLDVVDMSDPLPEAYELVEDGHITWSDFPTSSSAIRCACGNSEPRIAHPKAEFAQPVELIEPRNARTDHDGI